MYLYETIYKTTHCMYWLLHHLKVMWQCMRPSNRLDQCTFPKGAEQDKEKELVDPVRLKAPDRVL